ncbi:radical SAM protein [Morganella morganii subsp. sibonii]
MNPYFECSIFISEKKWIERFINLRANNNISFLWRTESRVDKLNINHIPLLAKAGLKVIDLGLESASEVQLKKMGKTKNPANYLKKASELLKACYENRIKTKVNIMLYAGETYETLDKTLQWLRAHKDYIYGVSAGVVFAFGWDENKKEYLDEMISLGASIYQKNNLIGVTKFNLSDEIDYDESMKLIKDISNEFMSDDHYFYLKSFSYYPRDYTKTQFDIDINNERIKQS